MRCRKCRSLYTSYKDGDLPTRVASEILKHLGECRACKSIYEGIDGILDASASLVRFAVADGFAGRVVPRIRSSEVVPPVRGYRLKWFAPRLAYGFAVMLVAGLVTFFSTHFYARNAGVRVAQIAQRETVYSLGPAPEPAELVMRERSYSLGQVSGSQNVIYSLPTHAGRTRLASY